METMVSVTLLTITILGLYLMDSRALALTRAARDNVVANRILEDRAEQILATSWNNLTNPAYLSGTLLANETPSSKALLSSGDLLGNLLETIDVNPFPISGSSHRDASRAASTIEVKRNWQNQTHYTEAGGDSTISDPNTKAISIDITITWKGVGSRPFSKVRTILVTKPATSN